MTLSVALRAALGIALLTAMDGVIKGQMQHHPFIVALFMRFMMGGFCALAVLAIARPKRPTRASLIGNTARVPLVDVKFFGTAILIQRETGGNLSEILDNLANVVRERFKIRRQVRVHTAHGRFTGYVLLALPAALGIALSFINADHMNLLFKERMGQMMLIGAIIMQSIGFVWIRQIVKIEV